MNQGERGCLTAWLVLLLVVLGVGSIGYFFMGMVMVRDGAAQGGGISILLSVLFSIGAAGAASLLAGRKFGFYLLVFAFIGASILQVVAALRIDMAVLGLLNIGIVWWLVRPQWAGLQ